MNDLVAILTARYGNDGRVLAVYLYWERLARRVAVRRVTPSMG